MTATRRGLTADERLAMLERDRARLKRERLQRELAGPSWRRMVRTLPITLRAEGTLLARELRSDLEAVTEALRDQGVFALDTAMRLAHGHGFLSAGDVHVYLTSTESLGRLADAGLVSASTHEDTVLVRPWAGPPRLLACVVSELPESRLVAGDYRVVTAERLRQELVGAVGARVDLFTLLERAEAGQ
ncbi:MAG: hypothetical protein R3B40_09720 [Polyangiales bacterium]|nr:hypothetical protein [Sandaracinaceae bacterium]